MNTLVKPSGESFFPPSGPLCWKDWHAQIFTPSAVTIFGVIVAALLILWCDGAKWVAWRLSTEHPHRADPPEWQLLTSQEWLQRAGQRAEAGEFRRALGTINYALALAPQNAELLNFKGDMYESLLRFRDAQVAYEKALRSDAGNRHARENLILCQRLNRIRNDPASQRSTLYALHRVMLDQSRVGEALAIGERMKSDRLLLQTSWQAALDQTGLPGKITVTENNMMDLDLSGVIQPDLSLIKSFPLTSLNLSHTRLTDVRALRGLRLEKLDLSQTPVDELSPLRGMPLQTLRIPGTGVVDLSPLVGCPLRELDISGTRISDLSILVQSKLTILRADDAPITDLRPLSALPLIELYLSRSKVKDLKPLCCLGLRILALDGTIVSDLSPLRGGLLNGLYLASTNVSDLRPLMGMPLNVLDLSNCEHVLDLEPLAMCNDLEHLLIPPQARPLEPLEKLPRLRFIQHQQINREDMLLMDLNLYRPRPDGPLATLAL